MSHPYKQHRDAERKIAKARYRAEGGAVNSKEYSRALREIRWLGKKSESHKGSFQDWDMRMAEDVSNAVPRRPYRDVLDVKVHD